VKAEDGSGWYLMVNGQRIRFSSEAERDRVARALNELEEIRRDRIARGQRAIDFVLAGRPKRIERGS
jgi:hypothetical protein